MHNYFQLLEISNESSRPSTPFARSPDVNGAGYSAASSAHSHPLGGGGGGSATAIHSEHMAEGYFSAFFREECRLGMGANGSVYLCQVSKHRWQICSLLVLCLTRCAARAPWKPFRYDLQLTV